LDRLLSVNTALANVHVVLTVTVAAFAVEMLAQLKSSTAAKVELRDLVENSHLMVQVIIYHLQFPRLDAGTNFPNLLHGGGMVGLEGK